MRPEILPSGKRIANAPLDLEALVVEMVERVGNKAVVVLMVLKEAYVRLRYWNVRAALVVLVLASMK